MQYIFGIDAGGTKTKCVITDINGKVLSEYTGSASNLLLNAGKETFPTILWMLKKSKNDLKIRYEDIRIIVIGAAGAGIKSNALRFEARLTSFLKSNNIELQKIHFESDARIALEGAFAGKHGCIVIAGTGSIILGKDTSGNLFRAGGFGRIIGDEGGGYSIGRKALNAVAKDMDGGSRKTQITGLIKEKLSIHSPEEMINKIYKHKLDIASIAPLVIKAAENGDKTAFAILNKESDELLSLIRLMRNKTGQPILKVSLIGGLITGKNFYRKMLSNKIKANLPEVKIVKPKFPPEIGAVIIAKQLLSSYKQN